MAYKTDAEATAAWDCNVLARLLAKQRREAQAFLRRGMTYEAAQMTRAANETQQELDKKSGT